jgi:hypothetical protein
MAGPATEETDLDRSGHSQPNSDPAVRAGLKARSNLLTAGRMQVVGEADLAPCVRSWLNGEAVPI